MDVEMEEEFHLTTVERHDDDDDNEGEASNKLSHKSGNGFY